MIRSCTFSFVRFEHPVLNDTSLDIPYTLPVYSSHDIAFRFLVESDINYNVQLKAAVANTTGVVIQQLNVDAQALRYRYQLNGLFNYISFDLANILIDGVQKIYNITCTPERLVEILEEDFSYEMTGDYLTDRGVITVQIEAYDNGSQTTFSGVRPPYWHEGFVKIQKPLTLTGCFTYAIMQNNTVLGFSNSFRVVDEDCYTSVFTYSCNEDALGFTYGDPNVVRIPVYLLKPDWPAKRVVNRQSDGRTQLLSALMEKQYVIETEHMPEVFHECLRAALLHDTVIIACNSIREKTVEVLEADNYTVAWNDDYKLSYAQGKGTLKVASFGYTNSNC